MSASLVGSEMCIRDRASARHACGDGLLDGPARGCFPGWAGLSVCIGAVSYTHLTLPTICSV
eukprot:4096649-Alexandrium_andersonii.AAC.1